ncbi:hypothetical protein CAL18_16675 [Bordetella genomosp. 7]|jgi:uncharacterized membrane protein YhdT|uniref:Uncharacterized protein n=1 Tax=Bordetella genomosp. 7 TaxID=1416805 RepID=A0A261QUH9_9BORD|nr:hypothetical protein [Bordetella genomosp. 7]OZI16371.1 hypothetical protein CAL19_16920 [Bordetella genomosp. 7]OZI16900.1 hypothetical protein CAL18_16675 [Bordetella genomosp. 7]
MGTRYGRRRSDGTYEYHDSEASLKAAKRQENQRARAGFFGLVGLAVGGWLAYLGLQYAGAADWPKWTRFAGVLAGAGFCAVLFSMLAEVIWKLMAGLLVLAILTVIGTSIWQAV